jgi:hypothetical protein
VPGASLSKSGTALSTAPDTTHTGTASVGSFNSSTGQATLTGTPYLAQSGATLQLSGGGVSSNTASFNVASAAANGITATVPNSCCDADTGNAGFLLTVTVTDAYANPVPSQTVDLTSTLASTTVDTSATPHKVNAVALPVSVVTGASGVGTGVAKPTLYDTTAGDSGQITATVHSTAVTNHTPTITISPGVLAHLSATTPSTPQVAGTAYTITVTATDAYANAVNPTMATTACNGASTSIACTGPAFDTAPDSTAGSASFPSVTPFSNGTATLTVTSYKAEPNVTVTLTSGSVTTQTGSYTVNPAAATRFYVTSNSSHYTASTHTVHPTSGSEIDTFTITMVDAWRNAAADHLTDIIHVTLTGGTTPDGGTLTGGSQTTATDTLGAVSVNVTLTGGTGTFSYQAAATLVGGSSGTISFSDTPTPSITPTPSTVTVQN